MERLLTIVGAQRGQATAEYALILLVVGLVVGALATFVKGGGLSGMFTTIIDGLIERANG